MGSPVLTPARTCPLAVRACQAQQAASLAAGVRLVNSPRMGCVCSLLTVTAIFSLGPWVSSIFLVLPPCHPLPPSSPLSCSTALPGSASLPVGPRPRLQVGNWKPCISHILG